MKLSGLPRGSRATDSLQRLVPDASTPLPPARRRAFRREHRGLAMHRRSLRSVAEEVV